ncbi:MAG TPA: 16S rRNA (cytidine(1402)-2'-O)-methyltransferase [Rhodospirillaceae bacterium]|nr:16S rRNA (cytidine(1402)-2'-O)-methyltransferase [Rhodospirillaceae bacterium]
MVRTDEKKKTWPAFASWSSRLGHAIEEEASSKPLALESGLYLVATPIGNLGDITLRALWVLKQADVILCEDTRVSGKLLQLYGIEKKRLISCHDHNEAGRTKDVLARLQKGEALALVSDAGTPLLADPGYKLVQACHEKGHAVFAVPGASALLAALTSAGLPTDRFLFVGFLPNKKTARRKEIEALQTIYETTLVFYESPQRLAATLSDMSARFGASRKAVIVRELTKLYEEKREGTLEELALHYEEAPAPKGEIVILVAPAPQSDAVPENWEEMLRTALQTMSLRDAVETLTKATGLKKSLVYQKALFFSQEN